MAYLLQLLVLQVAANHHLEHNEELAVADEAVAVNVVDLEGKLQLLLLVALAAEGAQAGDELLEVDIATAVLVKDGNHANRIVELAADLFIYSYTNKGGGASGV